MIQTTLASLCKASVASQFLRLLICNLCHLRPRNFWIL